MTTYDEIAEHVFEMSYNNLSPDEQKWVRELRNLINGKSK